MVRPGETKSTGGVWKASPSPSDSDAASWATITLAPKAFGAGELSTLPSAATEHGRFETCRTPDSALCTLRLHHSTFCILPSALDGVRLHAWMKRNRMPLRRSRPACRSLGAGRCFVDEC